MDASIDKVKNLPEKSAQVNILKNGYWNRTVSENPKLEDYNYRVEAFFDSKSDALSTALIVGWNNNNIKTIGKNSNVYHIYHDFADKNEVESFCKVMGKRKIYVFPNALDIVDREQGQQNHLNK